MSLNASAYVESRFAACRLCGRSEENVFCNRYNLVGVNIETQPMTATARKKAKRLQKQRERERLATLQQQQQQQQQWLQQQQLRLQQEQQQQQQQQQQPQTSSTQDLPPGMPPGHTQPAVDVKQVCRSCSGVRVCIYLTPASFARQELRCWPQPDGTSILTLQVVIHTTTTHRLDKPFGTVLLIFRPWTPSQRILPRRWHRWHRWFPQ